MFTRRDVTKLAAALGLGAAALPAAQRAGAAGQPSVEPLSADFGLSLHTIGADGHLSGEYNLVAHVAVAPDGSVTLTPGAQHHWGAEGRDRTELPPVTLPADSPARALPDALLASSARWGRAVNEGNRQRA
jgi:hypothetical protein